MSHYRAEIWQNGMRVAAVDAPTASAALWEISHYAAQYEQDGPVKIKVKIRRSSSPSRRATMIRAEQVPQAVKDAFYNAYREEATDEEAIAAAINAWPNRRAEWRNNITFDGKPIRYSVIILPIPQETGDE